MNTLLILFGLPISSPHYLVPSLQSPLSILFNHLQFTYLFVLLCEGISLPHLSNPFPTPSISHLSLLLITPYPCTCLAIPLSSSLSPPLILPFSHVICSVLSLSPCLISPSSYPPPLWASSPHLPPHFLLTQSPFPYNSNHCPHLSARLSSTQAQSVLSQ